MARHEESLEEYSHRLEKLYNDISQVKKDYLEGLKQWRLVSNDETYLL